MGIQAVLEIRPVPRTFGRPDHFRQAAHPRERHVFRVLRCRYIFGPQITLGAQYVLLFARIQFPGHGFEAVDFFKGHESPDSRRFAFFGLIIVEIAEIRGRHHHVMPLRSCRDAALHAAPGHDGRLRRQAPLQDLVPSDEPSALGCDEFFDALDEIALQLPLVL